MRKVLSKPRGPGARLKCIHCNADLIPSTWERLPDSYWSVSFTCEKCQKENRVRWPVTAGLMLFSMLATVAVGLGVASIHPINVPGVWFGVVAVAFLSTTFILLLSMYLRASKRPFADK